MNKKIYYLHHELNILSQVVSYKNMSAAAENIGLSQPQISRVISKIEGDLGVHLLNRTSRRSSSWTEMARQLARLYSQRMKSLDQEIYQAIEGSHPKAVSIAILEGLIPTACDFCYKLLQKTELESVVLDVYDLNILEAQFAKQNMDIIISSREPGRTKFVYNRIIGYQKMNQIKGRGNFTVLSRAEHALQQGRAQKQKASGVHRPEIVSNSLAVRKTWIEKYGGLGRVPSGLNSQVSDPSSFLPVRMIAHDSFNAKLWAIVEEVLESL